MLIINGIQKNDKRWLVHHDYIEKKAWEIEKLSVHTVTLLAILNLHYDHVTIIVVYIESMWRVYHNSIVLGFTWSCINRTSFTQSDSKQSLNTGSGYYYLIVTKNYLGLYAEQEFTAFLALNKPTQRWIIFIGWALRVFCGFFYKTDSQHQIQQG